MTRPSKRELERTVDEFEASPAAVDDERIDRLKDALGSYPDCDFETAIAILDEMEANRAGQRESGDT